MPADRGSRRIGRALAALAALGALGVLACENLPASSPPGTLPAFVYVSGTPGYADLVRFRNDSTVQLTSGSRNTDPNSAAGRLVFTSDRDAGYPQVYIADLDVTTVHRVMSTPAFDRTPSLSPTADSIVFVTTRAGGTPHIWVIAAPALNAVGYGSAAALATGDSAYTPEDAPAWSPAGGKIAFTSVSSGTSQVYVVPSGGGTAVAITQESGGAFEPAWSGDGSAVYYIAAVGGYALRRVSVQGGQATTVVADSFRVAGPASCNASYCLYSTLFNSDSGAMSALRVSDNTIQTIFARTAAMERQPAILVP